MGRARAWTSLTVFALSACGEAPPVDHAAPDEDGLGERLEQLCSPKLDRYPVAGPHNGGYDKNALHYTCPPHPSHAPDGSDFLAGDHYGNDVFAAKGTPVVAPVSGTVVTAGTNSVGGLVVKIRDACNWDYYHAHLDAIAGGIAVGVHVNAGQQIGVVGNTGNASGTSPHLHFSVFPAGNYNAGIDPFPLLQSVDATACQGTCQAHCEGDIIVNDDCSSGDCSKFGASCVDNAKGVRCVVFYCADAPDTAHDVCLLDGNRGRCSDTGQITDLGPCPAGSSCEGGVCKQPGGSGGGGAGGGSGGAGAGGQAGAIEPASGGLAGAAGAADGWGSGAGWRDGKTIQANADSHVPGDVEGGCACSAPAHDSGSKRALVFGLVALLALGRRRR